MTALPDAITTTTKAATPMQGQLDQLVAGIKQSFAEERRHNEAGAIATPAATATLSQSELFRRYLDAPVRVVASTSTLVDYKNANMITADTARDNFCIDQYAFSEGNFAEAVLQFVEAQEFPSIAMANALDELSALVEALKRLKEDFDRLAEFTRTDEPDADAPDEVYNDWEQNPRYVLPPAPPQN